MKTSVVLTAYKRAAQLANTLQSYRMQERQPDQIIVVEDGYDDGKTDGVCHAARIGAGLPVEYYCHRNRQDLGVAPPGIPKNIGIRRAVGEILVLQCAEVRFTKPTDFDNLVRPVEENEWVSVVAPCEELRRDGTHDRWLCTPGGTNYNHFCQSYRTAHLVAVGGFDERFRGAGLEDHDFNWRLYSLGLRLQMADNILTQHQFHERYSNPDENGDIAFNRVMAEKAMRDFYAGDREAIVANKGKSWGDLA